MADVSVDARGQDDQFRGGSMAQPANRVGAHHAVLVAD
jgi:hypothetical protein